METAMSKRQTTFGHHDRAEFGLNSRVGSGEKEFQSDDLVGLAAMAEQDRPDTSLAWGIGSCS
jgi:hypothetical protein